MREKQIIRYFIEGLPPAERDELMTWLTADEQNMALFKEYERIFDKSSHYVHKADAEEAFARLMPAPAYKNRMPAWAMLLLLLFFLGAGAYFIGKITPKKALQNKVYSISSATGQKAVVLLADGSRVTLNSGSRLVYPASFNKRIRMVKLEGEAFFEVSHDPSRPFCILSSGLLTRVLGTSFNIESYHNSNTVVVTVATGHVAVEKLGDKISSRVSDLLPGQQLSFNLQNQSAKIHAVNIADVIAWKENRLVFDNTTFSRIAPSIERLYGLRVIYPEKTLAKTPFTARFSSNTPLAEVMRVLALTGQFSYTIKDSAVYIKQRNMMK